MSPTRFTLDPSSSPYAPDLPTAAPPASAGGPGWAARAGLLLAGVLVLGTLFAHVNPVFGFLFQERGTEVTDWPWGLFQGETGWRFVWQPPTAWVLSLGASGVLLVLAALLRPGALRGGAALVAGAVVGTTLLPPREHASLLLAWGLNLALALLAAGVTAAVAQPRPRAALRTVASATLALVLLLLLPLPAPPPSDDAPAQARPGYASEVTRALTLYGDRLAGRPVDAPEAPAAPAPDEPWLLATQPILAWAPAALVGLLLLLGLRWRGLAPVMAILLLFAVLAPSGWGALARLRQEEAALRSATALSSTETLQMLAVGGTQSLTLLFRLSMLPLALGVADLNRARRP